MRTAIAGAVFIQRQDAVDHLGAALGQEIRLLGGQGVGDHHEAVATEQLGGVLNIRGLQDFQALHPIVGFEIGPQICDLGPCPRIGLVKPHHASSQMHKFNDWRR